MRYSPIEGEVFICLEAKLTWSAGRVKARCEQRKMQKGEMLLTSFPPALHCVVRANNLNMLTENDIKNALKGVKYPGYSRDIVSFGLVKQKIGRASCRERV